MNTTYFTNLLSPLAIMSITQSHWQESFRCCWARLHSFFWVFPCFTRRNRSNINKVIGILAKYRITSQIFKIYAFSSSPSLKNYTQMLAIHHKYLGGKILPHPYGWLFQALLKPKAFSAANVHNYCIKICRWSWNSSPNLMGFLNFPKLEFVPSIVLRVNRW